MKKEFIIEGKNNKERITLYGSGKTIEVDEIIIKMLELTGIEHKDRLIIQKCIDDNSIKSKVLYAGNMVYPFEKTIREYRKLEIEDTLENLTDYMYEFFINACGDIAHYDKQGFISYYENSFSNLRKELLSECVIPIWYSDLNKIFKELKIGKDYYDFNEDEIHIDLNELEKRVFEKSELDKLTVKELKELENKISDKEDDLLNSIEPFDRNKFRNLNDNRRLVSNLYYDKIRG